MAPGNSKDTAQRSFGNASEHKAAILKALSTLQDHHAKNSETWKLIEKAKKEVEQDTDEKILLAKRTILYEEFKKEIDSALSEEKKE